MTIAPVSPLAPAKTPAPAERDVVIVYTRFIG